MRKSRVTAFCGIMTGLSVTLLFFAGVIPAGTYAFSAAAGLVLSVVVAEQGLKTSLLCYLAAAVLGLILTPDKEAAVLFVTFFGLYPTVKNLLERQNHRWKEYFLKFLFFNLSVLLGYAVLFWIFAFPNEFAGNGSYLIFMLAAANLSFFIYDKAFTALITFYIRAVRPKISKK